jgi:DNA-directed RNA polymerase subunit RPC12/RpoP
MSEIDEIDDQDVKMFYEKLVLFEEMGLYESMFDRGCDDEEEILKNHQNDKLYVKCLDCGHKIEQSRCGKCGSRKMELHSE